VWSARGPGAGGAGGGGGGGGGGPPPPNTQVCTLPISNPLWCRVSTELFNPLKWVQKRLYCLKVTRIEAIKNLTRGHLWDNVAWLLHNLFSTFCNYGPLFVSMWLVKYMAVKDLIFFTSYCVWVPQIVKKGVNWKIILNDIFPRKLLSTLQWMVRSM
jgi:hypothetical protein